MNAHRNGRFHVAVSSALLVVLIFCFGSPICADDAPAPNSLTLSLAALARAERGSVTFEYLGLRLDDALANFTRATGIPIRAEWEPLARISIARDDLVEWSAQNLPPLAALRTLALSLGTDLDRPVIDASQGTLILTSLQALATHRETAFYDVADIATDPTLIEAFAATMTEEEEEEQSRLVDPHLLVDARSAAEQVERLALLLLEHVDPEGWMNFGGSRGRLSPEAGRLLVTASPATHGALRRLLAEMRTQAPTSGHVRLALFAVKGDAHAILERFRAAPIGERAGILDELRLDAGARRLVEPSLVLRLDEEARITSRDEANPGALSIEVALRLRHDRVRRSLALALDLDLAFASRRTSIATTIDLRPGEAELLLLPTASDEREQILLVVEATTRARGAE